MTSICKKIQALKFCRCPTPSVFDDLPTEVMPPFRRSPLDHLGFTSKCCWFIPLRPAAFIICFIILMWGVLQVVTSEKLAAAIFLDNEGYLFYCSKIILMCLATTLIVACGVSLIGIFLSKHVLVHIFIWYTFIYNLSHFGLALSMFGLNLFRQGSTTGRHVLRLVLFMLWNCVVFYFLRIINSYKMVIWMP